MPLVVRRTLGNRDVTHREMGRDLPVPHVVAWTAVVIENPWPTGYVADLVTLADEVGAELGALVGPACVELLGMPVEAFGKLALVGLDGELEQGSALIHNLRFGNVFRDAAGCTELLPAAEKVAVTGATVDVPLKHLLDAKTRSHHQTVTLTVPDAPRPREIVVGCVAASGGRPLARLAAFASEIS